MSLDNKTKKTIEINVMASVRNILLVVLCAGMMGMGMVKMVGVPELVERFAEWGFTRWMVFAIEHVCKRQGTQHADPVATAHAVISPLRRWINSPMSSRRSTQASESFYDDSSVESKEDDTPVGSPTASETRDVESTGTDATLANEGRLSYG